MRTWLDGAEGVGDTRPAAHPVVKTSASVRPVIALLSQHAARLVYTFKRDPGSDSELPEMMVRVPVSKHVPRLISPWEKQNGASIETP